MSIFNSMQANLGLIPGAGPQAQVKSPAQAAAELSAQASAQMQMAQQMMPITRSSTAAFTFGQQFQQQFSQAQAQSSMNPYAANMLGTFTQPSALPSAMMMTPASTGVFRPPMPYGSGAGGTPMSPMPVMPLFNTPFTPQLPAPSFRTPWEQEIQQRELRADQLYSMTTQTPRFGGMAAGYGMGALAGAAVGGRFGMLGRGVGAVLGGISAHYSGLASGMGAVSMFPMRPGLEAHKMGLSSQRMSQDWVVAGPNLHALGRGLSRDASMELGSGIQRLAESRSFKNETGGQFNQHDLMQIMQKSGQAGLMDFDQSVDRIQEQLRKVSRSVSRFMELTNDPDVNSVIRRMGQMHTFGMSVPEIENAASSMRSYSRAAGTTVGGLWQQGLPGAMTYQALGLSGGAGLQYGMYSAAAARQAVATGTYSNAELAMFGGVQGVAQRNMQAQGSFMSMPMFGAAVSSYGAGGWGMNAGALARMGSGAGPQGMVMGAVSGMNAAVGAGGIGALAMMPLQQRQIQDQAARTMSPYEQTAMRFSMAADTGKFLGLKGAGGFAAGARMLYGDEVATQMMTEAANPEYWRAQRSMIRQERDDIARSQRQQIMDAVPGVFDKIGRRIGMAVDVEPFAAAGAFLSRGWRDHISRPLQEQKDRAAGIITRDRLDPGMSADLTSREGREAYAARRRVGAGAGRGRSRGSGEVNMTGRDAFDAVMGDTFGEENIGLAGAVVTGLANMPSFALGFVPGVLADFALEAVGVDLGGAAQSALGSFYQGKGYHQEALKQAQRANAYSAERVSGAASRSLMGGFKTGEYTALEKSLGLKAGQGAWAVHAAGMEMAKAAENTSIWYSPADKTLTQGTLNTSMIRSLAASGDMSEAEVRKRLGKEGFNTAFEMAYASGRAGAGDTARGRFLSFEERVGGGQARGNLVATRKEIEDLRTKMEDREDQWGMGTGTAQEFRKLAAKYSPSETLALLYNNSAGLNKSQKAAWKAKIKAQIITDKRIKDPKDPRMAKVDEWAMGAVDRMSGVKVSDKLRLNMAEVAGRSTGADEVLSEIKNVTEMQTSELTSGIMGDISKTLMASGGKSISSDAELMGLSESDINLLRKKRTFGKLPDLLAGARGAGKKELGGIYNAVQDELMALGSGSSWSESLTSATGEQANSLAVANRKLMEVAELMNKSFQYFTEDAAKNFKEGALALNESTTGYLLRKGMGVISSLTGGDDK